MNRSDLQIGLPVIYSTPHKQEFGIVTSWNNHFVFVDYDGTGRGKATNIEDLEKNLYKYE